jgi:hypothetical protein
MPVYLAFLWAHLQTSVRHLRENSEDGYSTETVVVTAILAALALAAIGVTIYNKVIGKANGIGL